MNDRELLELAAKAAGLRIVDRSHPVTLYVESEGCKGGVLWNPIADDGDALRLAVKLRIEISYDSIATSAVASYYNTASHYSHYKHVGVEYVPDEMFYNGCEDDRRFAAYERDVMKVIVGRGAATRRAIVRAAAEIGRSLK